MTRDEIMRPFRMLPRAVLVHRDGLRMRMEMEPGPRGEAAAAGPDLREQAADALFGFLEKSLPAEWGLIRHAGEPESLPGPEPENQTAETCHARIEAMHQTLVGAGIAGAGNILRAPAGWLRVLEQAVAGMIRLKGEQEGPAVIRIQQIKEKFGTLRFYVFAAGTEEFSADVSRIALWAEMATEGRCIVTGLPGSLDHDGWVLTLCEEMKDRRAADPRGFPDMVYPPHPGPASDVIRPEAGP